MARGVRGEVSEIGIDNGGSGQLRSRRIREEEHKALAEKDLGELRERQEGCTE